MTGDVRQNISSSIEKRGAMEQKELCYTLTHIYRLMAKFKMQSVKDGLFRKNNNNGVGSS